MRDEPLFESSQRIGNAAGLAVLLGQGDEKARARLLLEGIWAYDIKQVSSIYVTAKTMIAP